MFPGVDVTKTKPELSEAISRGMNPHGLHPYHAMCLSRRVDKPFLADSFFDAPSFFLYYTRHDAPHKNRIYQADRASTLAFLDGRIYPEKREGIDVVVTTEAIDRFLICSHDGDMFFRDPSQWSPELLAPSEGGEATSSEPDSIQS